MQTWRQENPKVKINWEVAFEEFNESKMCGNIKRKREICLSQRWKKSRHGNILTSFCILAISFYYDIELTWFMQLQKENLKIQNYVVYWNFRICSIQGQNRPGSWPIPLLKNRNWHFIFSFLCFRVYSLWKLKNLS